MSPRWIIPSIIGFAVCIRLAVALSVDPYGSDTVDGFDYHNHAISLINGEGYPNRGSLPFMRPPLYPMLLAAVYYFVPHDSYLTARLLNAVLDTAACFVFFKLVMLVWESRSVAILSTLVYAINPLFLFFVARVRVEALFGLLLVSCIYLLVLNSKSETPGFKFIFVAGALLGLSVLTRPNALLLVAIVPVCLGLHYRTIFNKLAKVISVFVLGCVLVILPWSIRNYVVTGEMVLVTDGFGFNFWVSNTENKYRDITAKDHQEYLEADRLLWQETSKVEGQISGLSIKERSNRYTKLALEYIFENPGKWVKLNLLKTAEFWSPMGRMDMQGKQAILTLPFGLLMILGVLVFARSLFTTKFDDLYILLVLALIVAATIGGVMNWSSIRYRIPMVDAYVIPFAISLLMRKFKLH